MRGMDDPDLGPSFIGFGGAYTNVAHRIGSVMSICSKQRNLLGNGKNLTPGLDIPWLIHSYSTEFLGC